MVLNYIWVGFFVVGFLAAIVRFFMGDSGVFTLMVDSIFDMSKTGFEISLGLTGVLTFWMGIMKVGERGGMTNVIAKIFGPFFRKLFPSIPDNHPALGSIIMNFSANMLGLDNAATPLGLKAMEQMQQINPNKERASDAQIMFLTLNASGLTLLPTTVMVYRLQMGAADPSDIFIPTLLATTASTVVGLLAVSIYQKINLLNRVVLSYALILSVVLGFVVWGISGMEQQEVSRVSSVVSNGIIFIVVIAFVLMAFFKKQNVYEAFIDGAKDGFQTSVKIIPYMIAMLVAIGVFRSSGALDFICDGLTYLLNAVGINADFIPALPTAFMKPLSGSGARGMMIDCMKTFGADSFPARIACTMQGAADTTFYIIALYFGSVGIKQTRYAVTVGLIAEIAGLLAAVLVCYAFFGS